MPVRALGQVVAFEPHPENYDRVVRNVALNAFANVIVLPVALGASPGTALGWKEKTANSAAVTELLLDAVYRVLHVETGAAVPDPAASPSEGHLSAVVEAVRTG